MVRYDGGSQSPLPITEPSAETRGTHYNKAVIALVALSIVSVALIAISQPSEYGKVELEFNADTQQAISLEISKKKYDQAKSNVNSLSQEFSKLQAQLQQQVSVLQHARTNLVSQIATVEGGAPQSLPVTQQASLEAPEGEAEVEAPAADVFTEEPETANDPVGNLRNAAASIAGAGSATDAATAAAHALHYTEQVASRVGDLADQSEEQAERIVDAARLTQEAKEAMQSALEQSSRIVDYNTHAAQAVAQDSGFVSTGAQTIANYMKDIFRDTRSVHQAAAFAVKHMNADVSAADHAVEEIEADAQEAYDVLDHIHQADTAATGFATNARASAITAADAAEGALHGQRASVAGGLRSIAAAHSAETAAHAAAAYAAAARAGPFAPPHAPPLFISPPAPVPGVDAPADKDAALVQAKGLVDSVVVLMQQLTNALEAAGPDCDKVEQILTYYQTTMSRLHAEGQAVAVALSDEDMDLVQRYAEVEVHPFAGEIQEAVTAASNECNVPVKRFIPEVNYRAMTTAELRAAPAAAVSSLAAAHAQAKGGEEAAARRQLIAALKADVKAQAAVKRAARRAAASHAAAAA